jgi:hypothetical protein
MKTISRLKLMRVLRLRGIVLALLAVSLSAGLTAAHAKEPSVQPLLQGNGPHFHKQVTAWMSMWWVTRPTSLSVKLAWQ